ncbi:MAG: hypothetical protein AAF478_10170 [Pseudomonadota bacterium]
MTDDNIGAWDAATKLIYEFDALRSNPSSEAADRRYAIGLELVGLNLPDPFDEQSAAIAAQVDFILPLSASGRSYTAPPASSADTNNILDDEIPYETKHD